VIAAEAGDDLLLRRSPAQVVVVADQLDVRVVGIRARTAEEDPCEVAGAGLVAEQREDTVGEPNDRLARGRPEDVVIVEVLDRPLCGFGDFGAAVADVDAPETGAAVDQLAPLVILDAHAPAALDDQGAIAHVGGDRGERMEQALPVHLLERVVRFLLEHSLPPLERRDARPAVRAPESITGRPRWPEAGRLTRGRDCLRVVCSQRSCLSFRAHNNVAIQAWPSCRGSLSSTLSQDNWLLVHICNAGEIRSGSSRLAIVMQT
jgi:hypothetical protein